MIVDTTFVIDLFRNDKNAVALSGKLEESPVYTTTITVFEIIQGAKDSELGTLKQFFADQTILSLTAEAAERAGLLSKQLKSIGKTLNSEDCLIAGIALTNNMPVVTRNEKHFKQILGLRVVSY